MNPNRMKDDLLSLTVLLFALVGPRPAAADDLPPAPKRLALIVTVERYHTVTLKLLDHADNDGVLLSRAFRASGFDVELLNTVPGKVDQTRLATLANVRNHLVARAGDCQPEDTLVVVLIGHGLQGQNAADQYFCLRDSDAGRFDSMLPLAEVFRLLARCPAANKMLLLDVSRQAPTRRVIIPTLDDVQVPVSGVGVLASCRRLEFGIESASLGHGLFAYRLADGLTGAAAGPEGRVTWDGLCQYVRRRVPEDAWQGGDQTSRSQHPMELVTPADPNVVLAGPSTQPVITQARKFSKADETVRSDASACDESSGPGTLTRIGNAVVPVVNRVAGGSRPVLYQVGGVALLLLVVLVFTAGVNRCSLPKAAALIASGPIEVARAVGRSVAEFFAALGQGNGVVPSSSREGD